MGRHIPEVPKGTSLSLFVLPRVSGAKAALTPLMGPTQRRASVRAIEGFRKFIVFDKICLYVGAHCVNLTAHVLSFCIPGSAFAALTAAGLTTNLPLAGQAIQLHGMRHRQLTPSMAFSPIVTNGWGLAVAGVEVEGCDEV
jgi:hypothetical protein